MVYFSNIYTSSLIFVFTSFLITLPIILMIYRKYGYFDIKEVMTNYLFVYYLQTIFLLVLLPLPDNQYLIDHPLPLYQFVNLIPFTFVLDVIHYFEIHTFSLDALIMNSAFLQALFNIVMFIPFGIFMKNRFFKSFKFVFIASLVLSLFFELTQLSAIYGIYERPFRVFDIDDLMLNTLGGLVGYGIAPLFAWMFADRDRQRIKMTEMNTEVSIVAQYIIFLFDVMIYRVLFSLFSVVPLLLFSLLGHSSSGLEYIVMYIAMSVIVYALVFLVYVKKRRNEQTVAMRLLNYRMKSSYAHIQAFKRSFVVYVPIIFLMQLQELLERINSNSILIDCAGTVIVGVHIYWMLHWLRRVKVSWIDSHLDIKIVRSDV